jgi:hypothetical protein
MLEVMDVHFGGLVLLLELGSPSRGGGGGL